MPSDKTPLEDSRLDLTADHVVLHTISGDEAQELQDHASEELAETINEAFNYINLEGKDAIIVLTIKA